MAMANLNQTFNTFSEIFDTLTAKQSTVKTKSNTIVAAVGAVCVAVSVGLSTWAESAGVAPGWLSGVVLVLGMVAQVFGVSRTKNYVTPNIREQFNAEFARRIDENHNHVQPVVPEGFKLTPVTPVAPGGSAPGCNISGNNITTGNNIAEFLTRMASRDADSV